jgi:signal transduction histidine kinase
MHRVWHIDSGDFQGASDARKDFADYLRQAAEPGSDCPAAVVIFGELISNALNHGRGSVQAVVAAAAPHAILWVEDAGEGFAPELVKQPLRGGPGGRGILIVSALARTLQAARVEGGRFRITVELPVRFAECEQLAAALD